MSNALAVAGIPVALVGHQGGWDEILLVVGPIAIVVGLLALARRRIRRLDRSTADLGGHSPESETTTTQMGQ